MRCSLRAISPRPRQKLGLETDVIAAGQSGLWTDSVIVGWCDVGATSEAAWDLPRSAEGAVTPHIADALSDSCAEIIFAQVLASGCAMTLTDIFSGCALELETAATREEARHIIDEMLHSDATRSSALRSTLTTSGGRPGRTADRRIAPNRSRKDWGSILSGSRPIARAEDVITLHRLLAPLASGRVSPNRFKGFWKD